MEQTFIEWWKGLNSIEKDEVAIALHKKCNIALSTVAKWGCGNRTPGIRTQVIIINYLKTHKGITATSETLFPAS